MRAHGGEARHRQLLGRAVLCATALPLVLAMLLPLTACRRDALVMENAQADLPADGRVHTLLTLRRKSGGPLGPGAVSVTSEPRPDLADRILLVQNEPDRSRAVTVLLEAPVQPAEERLFFRWHGRRIVANVKLMPDARDSFGDGTPDFLRLHSGSDRRAFRAWFTGIAEQEFAASQPAPEINDCAALLRYCFRMALAEHGAAWISSQSFPAGLLSQPSIRQYRYPHTPLGAGLFRVRPGRFALTDLSDGTFAQFADARSLMQWNSYLAGRDMAQAQPGDLLFFRQLEQDSQYHSMIVTGERADWLIYHTGPIGKSKGGMRRISRRDLLRYPDARWRPVPGNSNFLGVYRWNILREGD